MRGVKLAPVRLSLLLPGARGEWAHRAFARNLGENRRSYGYFAGGLFPRDGNPSRQGNAENDGRTFAGRDSFPGRNQALQLDAIRRRQAVGAGDDPQNGHHDSSAGSQTPDPAACRITHSPTVFAYRRNSIPGRPAPTGRLFLRLEVLSPGIPITDRKS